MIAYVFRDKNTDSHIILQIRILNLLCTINHIIILIAQRTTHNFWNYPNNLEGKEPLKKHNQLDFIIFEILIFLVNS